MLDLPAEFQSDSPLDLGVYLHAIESVNHGTGVSIADARQPDMPLVFISHGFTMLTGYQPQEVIGRNCRFLQRDDHDQPDLPQLRAAIRQGRHCNVLLRNYRKTGEMFYNELYLSPVHNSAGELTHFVGIQHNVTERIRAEEETRKALARERELNEIKSRFLRMVSHEFRTPLTAIQGSASFVREYEDRLAPEKRERHFVNIEQALKRMNGLLDQVLLVSRAEAGKLPFRPTPLQPVAFCESLVEEYTYAYPGRRIQWQPELEANRAYLLDENLLSHILHNLLNNALKYSPPVEPVHFRLGLNEDRLVFEVRDRGIGIPRPEQRDLFQPFHRASNVGQIQGTGLGLNIVKRSTELHGGEITFESEERRGTAFRVRLPAQPAA
ncbi:MAG: ATP-binding protein [Verrucomicrobiota bacterium JB022]|nr:ATP-binding protein [Verrucomicrobiota bacterium JB022]